MMRKPCLGFAALLAFGGCSHKDVSGAYIAKDAASTAWLQIVRTPDNHLTGQMIVSKIEANGTVDRESVNLSGAVNGDSLTLTTEGLLGLGSKTMSGTFDGDRLSLMGTGGTVTLTRTSLSGYQAVTKELDTHAQSVKVSHDAAVKQQQAAHAEEAFSNGVGRLIEQMQQFNAQADVHLSKLPNAETRYNDLTNKMQQVINKERQLGSNENTSYARSQLVYGANQLSYATEQVHYSVQSVESSLIADGKPLFERAGILARECSQGVNITSQPQKDACDRFMNANPTFQDRYRSMVAELGHLEQVYKAQTLTQQGLLKTAERLER